MEWVYTRWIFTESRDLISSSSKQPVWSWRRLRKLHALSWICISVSLSQWYEYAKNVGAVFKGRNWNLPICAAHTWRINYANWKLNIIRVYTVHRICFQTNDRRRRRSLIGSGQSTCQAHDAQDCFQLKVAFKCFISSVNFPTINTKF